MPSIAKVEKKPVREPVAALAAANSTISRGSNPQDCEKSLFVLPPCQSNATNPILSKVAN
jgi:hypothetical protein